MAKARAKAAKRLTVGSWEMLPTIPIGSGHRLVTDEASSLEYTEWIRLADREDDQNATWRGHELIGRYNAQVDAACVTFLGHDYGGEA